MYEQRSTCSSSIRNTFGDRPMPRRTLQHDRWLLITSDRYE